MKSTTKRMLLLFSLLLNTVMMFAYDPLPGDPGIQVPLDGGILLSLLAGGGIVAAIFIKKKKK
jgi:hypothetical protein